MNEETDMNVRVPEVAQEETTVLPTGVYKNGSAAEEAFTIPSVQDDAKSSGARFGAPAVPSDDLERERKRNRRRDLLLVAVLAAVCGLAGGLAGGAVMNALMGSAQSTTMEMPQGDMGQMGDAPDAQTSGTQNEGSDVSSSGDAEASSDAADGDNASAPEKPEGTEGEEPPAKPDGESTSGDTSASEGSEA